MLNRAGIAIVVPGPEVGSEVFNGDITPAFGKVLGNQSAVAMVCRSLAAQEYRVVQQR